VNRDIDMLAILKDSALSLVGVLLVLGCAEGLLRTQAVSEALPLPLIYYGYDVPRKLQLLDRLVDKEPQLDVLFVGSSIVRAAFDPRTFDRERRSHTKRRSVSFNAGLPSMFPAGTAMYLERVWLRHARPRFLLLGVREIELRSTHRVLKELRSGRLESLWYGPKPFSPLRGDVFQQLHVLHYRGTVHKIMKRLQAGKPLNDVERGEYTTDAWGFRGQPGVLSKKYKSGKGRFLWKYGNRIPKDRYRVSFPLLERMHALCKTRGIRFVLVNVPEHPERFGSKLGKDVWKAYHEDVSAWAVANGVPFLDITDGDYKRFGKNSHFADFNHLRPAGAKHFSKLLGAQFAKRIDAR
jgi:hypothetical protein